MAAGGNIVDLRVVAEQSHVPIKDCADCKWAVERHGFHHLTCEVPGLPALTSDNNSFLAINTRAPGSICGPNGDLWEPIPEDAPAPPAPPAPPSLWQRLLGWSA